MSIRTQIIDAITHSNYRSELRLDPMRKYSNLRLINLGCTISGSPGSMNYTDSAGVYGMIENAWLYNGSDVLDQLIGGAASWLSFSNLQQGGTEKDNGLDYSLYMSLSGSSRSYQLSNVTNQTIEHLLPKNGTSATTSVNTTFKGWLNCSRLFNLIARLPFLDSGLWNNLRIVIEWKTTATAIFAGDASGITAVNVLMPSLLADVVDDMQLPAMPKQVIFNRYEVEKVALPGVATAPAADTIQETRVRLLGFNGHVVNRLMLANVDKTNELSNVPDDKLKAYCSEALAGELIQLSVNGKTIIPYDGCNTGERKAHHLFNTWSSLNIVQGAQQVGNFEGLLDQQFYNSKQSYGGFAIGERIGELFFDHTRVLQNQGKYKPLECQVWAEVPMVLTLQGSNYVISYA